MENNKIEKILEDLSRIRNDTTKIKNRIDDLMKNISDAETLAYYLKECDFILLLKIKINLEKYIEINNFKRSLLLPNAALYISIFISCYSLLTNFVGFSKWMLPVVGLAAFVFVFFVEKVIYRDKILISEVYIEKVLNLVGFILESKKDDLDEIINEKKKYIIKKAPVKNTSAEK